MSYPDFQAFPQWTGAPLAQATANAIGGGSLDTGALPVGSWAAIILWAKATAQPITAVVTQTLGSGPAALTISETVTIAAGAQVASTIVMLGDTVEVVFTGGGAGCKLDYAVVPTNTTIATSVSTNPIITRVSALPASPTDTEVVSYAPNQVTWPGVEWLCIYNAATGYWDVIGGPPIVQTASPNLTLTLAQQNLSAAALSLPNDGDYLFSARFEGIMLPLAAGSYFSMGLSKNGGGLFLGSNDLCQQGYVPTIIPAGQALGYASTIVYGARQPLLKTDALRLAGVMINTTAGFTCYTADQVWLPVRIK